MLDILTYIVLGLFLVFAAILVLYALLRQH
jgi:hypothetical protein